MSAALPEGVKVTGSAGDWDVYLDGVRIGNVRADERHYNLLRPFTDRFWRATWQKEGASWTDKLSAKGLGEFVDRATAIDAVVYEQRLRDEPPVSEDELARLIAEDEARR